MENNKNIISEFGEFAQNYKTGRRGFPTQVYSYVLDRLKSRADLVLDLGCGPGLISGSLAKRDNLVVGCDIAEEAIYLAANSKSKDVTFRTCSVDKLPFSNDKFDLVTAFSAFHWFADEVSVKEIYRVLKMNAFFVAANKDEFSGFKKPSKAFLESFIPIEHSLVSPKRAFRPSLILARFGFEEVITKIFDHTEIYSLDEAVLYFTTTSLWNNIPVGKREQASHELRKFLVKNHENSDGTFNSCITITVVSGRKHNSQIELAA